MADRKADRSAWAAEVARLIREEASGNKSAFARTVGLKTVKTVDRWLAGAVDVSEASVLMVCRALNLEPVVMLLKVGLLDPEQVPQLRNAVHSAEADVRALELIRQANIPPSLKRQLTQHVREQAAEHERQRLAEVERMLELAKRTYEAG